MKAILIFRQKREMHNQAGKTIFIRMDLFEIHGKNKAQYPGGYKFSWIAFDAENPEDCVLFDSHPPKGPHMHHGKKSNEVPFEWISIEHAQKLFFEMVKKQFGELMEGRPKK